jgi:hypothetical protein
VLAKRAARARVHPGRPRALHPRRHDEIQRTACRESDRDYRLPSIHNAVGEPDNGDTDRSENATDHALDHARSARISSETPTHGTLSTTLPFWGPSQGCCIDMDQTAAACRRSPWEAATAGSSCTRATVAPSSHSLMRISTRYGMKGYSKCRAALGDTQGMPTADN